VSLTAAGLGNVAVSRGSTTRVWATFTPIAAGAGGAGRLRSVTVEEDRASDRRIAIAFGAVLVVQVALAFMADAGTYPLWLWLVLAVATVLVAGVVFAWVQARAEGPATRRRR